MAAESETVAEARRQMEICNACRYCEGYCAVFPAMTMRRSFTEGDLTHLANLCHGCKGCYHACQYAPPHAFGINIPATFAELRQESYAKNAWPAPMGRLFERSGTVVSLLAALGVALALILVVALQDPAVLWSAQRGVGAFFRVIPHWLMITLGVVTFGYAILAMAMGARNYCRSTGSPQGGFDPGPATEAAVDIVTMRNLGGGGHGCNDLDEGFSTRRRWLHQALFGGFMLCFAATCTGTLYHYILGWKSPHAFLSLPVQLGFWGGVLMMIGAAGLAHVKVITDPGPVAKKLAGGEFAILALLFLIAATGLLLLAVRHTGAMGAMLAIHLGLVFAFFLVMPYSKMVHGLYRGIALLRHAREKRTAPAPAAAA
ncbi:tricarballylate utilization 4Fe-4S protein TcuB [Neoroseomonas oryzicola]|uniref:Tricarballylate utilization 4Fe-4S protein TcuB n=1 Tax=Neoroseomonas oryzicola TaxID=535904 RepID=A0A9X9WKK5_9PROT|nr:tricarballylate utilization 4Fe-4S protein TcuB [Neoroseomonas oryzicola]MBR0660865.1 tricarballylate utilization 4Fe-4S protein TcuB [Neoroseomonas oryzicola]NKE19883.1 tricarballylate utilization 4Fe-4S protein TcuB [Neoroseomonas oryzicola]